MGWLSSLFGGPRRETSRAEMDDALKRLVVPELRAMGFKGSMPHFRRRRGENLDLLTFQFSKWGGAFTVEAARCRPAGLETPTGPVPAEKAKAWDLPHRYRIGADRVHSDHWFRFEKADPDSIAADLLAELAKPRLWEIVDTLPMDWPLVDRAGGGDA